MLQVPNPRRTSADLVAHALRDEILRGKHGVRLPAERALCDRFKVARNTIRSALGQLEGLGLVTPRQGSGYFVLPIPEEGGPELLEALVSFRTDPDLRWETIRDLLLVRRALARAVVQRIRAPVQEEELAAFDLAVATLTRAVEGSAGAETVAAADLDVARELASLTGSFVLRLCTNPIAHVIKTMPDLCAAMYARPEQSVAGWRVFREWLLLGAVGGADVALRPLELADLRTLRAYRRVHPSAKKLPRRAGRHEPRHEARHPKKTAR